MVASSMPASEDSSGATDGSMARRSVILPSVIPHVPLASFQYATGTQIPISGSVAYPFRVACDENQL